MRQKEKEESNIQTAGYLITLTIPCGPKAILLTISEYPGFLLNIIISAELQGESLKYSREYTKESK